MRHQSPLVTVPPSSLDIGASTPSVMDSGRHSEEDKSCTVTTNREVNRENQNEVVREMARRLEIMQAATPLRVVEIALEIQAERMRVVEVTTARDAAVNRLYEAYTTIRRHAELIEQLQQEREEQGLSRLSYPSATTVSDPAVGCALSARIRELEALVEEFRQINHCLRDYGLVERREMCDPPPHYEAGGIEKTSTAVQTDVPTVQVQLADSIPTTLCDSHPQLCKLMTSSPLDVIELIKGRNEMLAAIPLPENAPDMTLSPIVLPPQASLHELLNTATASLRTDLGNYRVFHSTTTNWCPDREEHGFMYTPMFKCNTNPRALTAHRWNAVDVIGRMAKPTECFYNNDGVWYYAGSYRSFLIDVISPQEWDQLSPETTTALIKETLAGRKNTTPQNNYETGQLYASGALKIACVALQCVGFNLGIYHSISELAAKFVQTKWKPLTMNTSGSMSPTTGSSSSGIIGTPSISSSSNSFSGLSPHGGIGHLNFGSASAGHSSLLPHPSSKLNSPRSSHGPSTGPCTPCMSHSGVSTPGVSPIGNALGSGLGVASGLASGSPAWNVAAAGAGKLRPGAGSGPGPINLDSASRLGLQLSNIRLSPGGTGGMVQNHNSYHQQQMRAGYFPSAPQLETGNEENLPPATLGSENAPVLMAGMAIGGMRHHDAANILNVGKAKGGLV